MTTHEGAGGRDTSPLELLRRLDRFELLATSVVLSVLSVLSVLAAATLLTAGLKRLLGLA